MKFNRLFVLTHGVAAAVARALPTNTSDIVHTTGYYDPNNLAPDGLWDKYQEKGAHYQCLFAANNEDAGHLVEDTRMPPSVQSVWSGNLYCE